MEEKIKEIRIMVAIKDRHTGYLTIFTTKTEGEAIRSFAEACEKQELFKRNPEDFQLDMVGKFDVISGTITPEIKMLSTAMTWVKAEKKKVDGK